MKELTKLKKLTKQLVKADEAAFIVTAEAKELKKQIKQLKEINNENK